MKNRLERPRLDLIITVIVGIWMVQACGLIRWGSRNPEKWTDASSIGGVSLFLHLHLVPDVSCIGYSPHKYPLSNHLLSKHHHHHPQHEDTHSCSSNTPDLTTPDPKTTPPIQMRTTAVLTNMASTCSLTALGPLPKGDRMLLSLSLPSKCPSSWQVPGSTVPSFPSAAQMYLGSLSRRFSYWMGQPHNLVYGMRVCV